METYYSMDEKMKLVEEILKPAMQYDIEDLIAARRSMRICSNRFEVCAKCLVALGAIASFVAPYIGNPYISIGAGAINVLSMSNFVLSSYCASESIERNTQINILLKSMGISTLPDIMEDADN